MLFDAVWYSKCPQLVPNVAKSLKNSLKLIEEKKVDIEKVFTQVKIGLGRCPRIKYTGNNDRDRISVSTGVTLFCDGGY